VYFLTPKKLLQLSREKKSRIILAIDLDSQEKIEKILTNLIEIIPSVKIGLPTIISLGIDRLKEILRKYDKTYYLLADTKLADVAHVMRKIIRKLKEADFNGFISHTFVGRKGALEELIKEANKLELDTFLVVAMSHPGGDEFILPHLEEFVKIANDLDIAGVIAPATKPKIVKLTREILREDKLILSPGIGPQGGKPGDAIYNGADFEIIGRLITSSKKPLETSIEIAKIQMEKLASKRI